MKTIIYILVYSAICIAFTPNALSCEGQDGASCQTSPRGSVQVFTYSYDKNALINKDVHYIFKHKNYQRPLIKLSEINIPNQNRKPISVVLKGNWSALGCDRTEISFDDRGDNREENEFDEIQSYGTIVLKVNGRYNDSNNNGIEDEIIFNTKRNKTYFAADEVGVRTVPDGVSHRIDFCKVPYCVGVPPDLRKMYFQRTEDFDSFFETKYHPFGFRSDYSTISNTTRDNNIKIEVFIKNWGGLVFVNPFQIEVQKTQ